MSVAQPVVPIPREQSAVPYVLPFGVFLAFLAAAPYINFLGWWEYPFRVLTLAVTLFVFSREALDFRVRSLLPSVALGIAVFALWIAPDVLIPGYRQHWLFQNAITGQLRSGLSDELRDNNLVLFFRAIRAVILVPIIEELFWRGWLMRWIINPNFRSVPLGAFTWPSMIITALLFASEHGPFWDVGLLTGLIYNWWMVRTRSLGDCILMHAVTNACLSGYVLVSGSWQYWL